MAVRRPVFTAMIFVGMMVLGLISFGRLPVELYQGQNQHIVSIIVNARGGLPPVDVERKITRPIEEAVATVSHLSSLYSSSREAESRVTMEFEPGTNMDFAALEVREKFSRVQPLLPKEIEKPVIANYDDAQGSILVFALTSENLSPEDIREIVETELKPMVARVNGVASVEVYGGRERKILVELDRDKMFAYNVSVERVMDILGQSNINLLAGKVDSGTLEYGIRTQGIFESVEEIGDIGIQATRQGSIIPLKEIATVKDSYLEPADYARLNLEQNVTVYVKKTSIANTIPVVKNVRLMLDDFGRDKEGKLNVIIVSDKAKIISRAIDDVKDALISGIILTVILIYVFLRKWMLALIVLVSIPTSMLCTFIFMDAFGISLNVMTLSGLALALGNLVDTSVVILENVFSKKEQGYSDIHAIQEGAEEMWLALMASLAATLIVFLPIIFIDKKIQIMYSGFAFTVSVSLIASFFVGLMLVPTMMAQFARGKIGNSGKKGPSPAKVRAQEIYHKLMYACMKARYPVVIGLSMLLAFSMYKLSKRDIDLPNTLEENEFSVIIFPLAGARLEANDDAVKKVEDLLSKVPDIEMYNSTVRKDDVRVHVRLKIKRDRQYSKEEIMNIVDEKGNEMVKEVHDDYSLIVDEGESGGEQKKLVINIFGHENDDLEKLANDFAKRMGKVPGLTNIVMTDLRKRPEYSLVVDKGRAALYGLSVKDVADSAHAQIRGMRPTKFRELSKGEEIETITRLQAIYRQKLEDLKFVHVAADTGGQVPIGEIANFYPSTGPTTIDRKDKYRYVFVKGDTKGALEKVAREVKAALKDVKLPEDYYWRFGGSYENLMQGKSELSTALLLTVFLIYMVMACLFESYLQPLLIMITVPMAAIGIWLSLEISHKPLSENVFIGMIMLAGNVVNTAIIMFDHMNHLQRTKKMALKEALVQSVTDRLRPIMMTAASTVIGFLPMAFNVGQSSDLWSPLAITVIGGLLSSTVLTLFVLPSFVLITEDIKDLLRPLSKHSPTQLPSGGTTA